MSVHPLIQTARGMCSDETPHVEIDWMLSEALEAAKDLEAENARLRAALSIAEFDASVAQTEKDAAIDVPVEAAERRDALNPGAKP